MKKILDSSVFVMLAICVFAMVGGSLLAISLINLANEFILRLN